LASNTFSSLTKNRPPKEINFHQENNFDFFSAKGTKKIKIVFLMPIAANFIT
jgi:hypothetical protein